MAQHDIRIRVGDEGHWTLYIAREEEDKIRFDLHWNNKTEPSREFVVDLEQFKAMLVVLGIR